MEIAIVSASFLALIPVVIGIVEVVKRVGLKAKYAPILSLVVGIGLAALIGGGWSEVILGGVIVGLSASGLYSGTKAAIQ